MSKTTPENSNSQIVEIAGAEDYVMSPENTTTTLDEGVRFPQEQTQGQPETTPAHTDEAIPAEYLDEDGNYDPMLEYAKNQLVVDEGEQQAETPESGPKQKTHRGGAGQGNRGAGSATAHSRERAGNDPRQQPKGEPKDTGTKDPEADTGSSAVDEFMRYPIKDKNEGQEQPASDQTAAESDPTGSPSKAGDNESKKEAADQEAADSSDSQGEQQAPASAQSGSAENAPTNAADTAGSKQAGQAGSKEHVDKKADQPLSERQRQFNEQIEQEGMLRMLRKELHDQLSQEGIADPDQAQQAAEAFLDDRFRDEVDAGLMNASMRKWVGKLLAADEEQFNNAINDEQDLREKAELYTDPEKTRSNPLLDWATRIKNWKDQFKEGLKGKENRRNRIAAYGVGALAVASTMTLAYRTGVNTGVEEGIAEGFSEGLAEGQDQIEAQESIIDRQGDVIDRQQDIIEGLEEETTEGSQNGEAGSELDDGSGASPEASEEASSLYGELAGEKVSFTIPEDGNVWNELEAVVDAKTSPETSPSEKQRLVGNMLEALEQENPGRDLNLVHPNEEFSITLPK